MLRGASPPQVAGSMKHTHKSSGELRIIAGKWRSRRIRFDFAANLRPTTDSARETLFNWLYDRITHAVCLDLFAGSGALAFEALSRGAEKAILIDSDRRCIVGLHQSAEHLQAQNCSIIRSDALAYLRRVNQKFDLVFIDPPYRTKLANQALGLLVSRNCLHADARVYLEVEREFDESNLAAEWKIVRHTRAGSRSHFLLSLESGSRA